MKFHSDLRYAIYGSSVRIGDSSEGLELTSLREHTPVERLLGQLAIGGVMMTRHQINWNTALFGRGEKGGVSLFLSLSLSNSQLAEPIHHLLPS